MQNEKLRKLFHNIKDSKKLTTRKREEWFGRLTTHPKIEYAVARISPRVIDRINIARAAHLGSWRVYQKLSHDKKTQALLDGSLYLPDGIPQQTIIKGDEKIPAISAASIIAKVTRDRHMARLHKKYPQYGFAAHKGYGTRLHRDMIAKWGISDAHRQSFSLI